MIPGPSDLTLQFRVSNVFWQYSKTCVFNKSDLWENIQRKSNFAKNKITISLCILNVLSRTVVRLTKTAAFPMYYEKIHIPIACISWLFQVLTEHTSGISFLSCTPDNTVFWQNLKNFMFISLKHLIRPHTKLCFFVPFFFFFHCMSIGST